MSDNYPYRSQGRRKSRFPAQTSVLSGASFDYFVNGVNYKIAYSDLLNSLGVTGSLVQNGADTATPILDNQGDVKAIRSLENAGGIGLAVSPDNGVSVSLSIDQDTTGSPIFDNLSAPTPTAASIVAGNGISVAKASNAITIASSAGLVNRVIVNQASDLAPPLDSTKEYFIDGIIDMGTQTIEVPEDGLTLAGFNFDVSKLVSSAPNYTMFTSPTGGSGNLIGRDYAVEVTGANSQVYDLKSATGNDAFEFARINYNDCTSLGTIDNYRQGLENGTGRFGGSPNLILAGAWTGGYFIETSIVRGLDAGFSGALFEAGTGFMMESRFRSNHNIDLPALASFVDFAPANFPNPSTLQFDGVILTRDGVSDSSDANLTPNITAGDLPSSWNNNKGLNNTFEGGFLRITTAATTTIPSASTFVDLDGTYTASELQHFDTPANGQLRHTGTDPREYRVIGFVPIEGNAGNDITLKVVKWDDSAGVFVDIYEQTRDITNIIFGTDQTLFQFNYPLTLDQNDYVKLQVANQSSAANVTAQAESYFEVIER